jgi:hypothetical protein
MIFTMKEQIEFCESALSTFQEKIGISSRFSQRRQAAA